MSQMQLWIYDKANSTWVPLAGTSAGAMSIHAIVEALNDIEDVDVATPTDQHIVYYDSASGTWKAKAIWTAAHKDSHDPQDGSDKLDTAAPVKVGSANATGTSHSLARADHVHEREHAIYTDAAAKAAAVQAGAITDAVTKAPTHDAVFDVKATADAAQPAATDAAAAVTAMGAKGDANPLHHDKYLDAAAKAQAEGAKLDDHAAPDDNTDLDAAAAQHGLMPKLDKVKLDAIAALADVTGSNAPQAHAASHNVAGSDELSGLFVGLEAVTAVYRMSNVSSSPRTATVSSVSGDVITLTTTEAYRFWHTEMNGNVYLKIANTTKGPVEYAWVMARPSTSSLQVTVAGDIVGWALNDVISTAEDGVDSVYIELDVSPSIAATAAFLGINLSVKDSGTIADYKGGLAFNTPAGVDISQYVQVSGITNRNWGIIPISGQKYYARDKATGTDTLTVGHYASAYIT